MWGHFSYLFTTLIFAGTPLVLLLLFGFHFYKKYISMIIILVLFFADITPFVEYPAILWKAWAFNPEKSLDIYVLKTNIETVICTSIVSLLWILIVLGATACQDNKKPILQTALFHMFKGTYAIWHKKEIHTGK